MRLCFIIITILILDNIQCKRHYYHRSNRSRYSPKNTNHHHHHRMYIDQLEKPMYSRNYNKFLAFHEGLGKLNTLEEYRETEIHDTQSPSLTHHHIRHHPELNGQDIHWPVKKEAVVEGNLVLGGLMMVHEREDSVTCGPIMPQGGIQALEAMLYTLDRLNEPQTALLPNITIGAHILDDCDKDTYGLEMAVDFIKGKNERKFGYSFRLSFL